MDIGYRQPYEEIRERAYIIVEELIQLYKMTDPKYGNKSECEKLENARICLSLFWELFDLLTYWAQCQIVAYKRGDVDGHYVQSMIEENKSINSDSHILEQIGDDFSKAAAEKFSEPEHNYFADEAEHMMDRGRYSQILRLFLFEILSSSSSLGHVWRFAFQKALKSMNYGQTDELFKPMPIKKVEASFELMEWKLEALLQV